MTSTQIDIIPSHQIDKQKWDDCINRSENDLIYAHSFYLDQLADNWHGIIVNDYECVMPVPWRKKFGITYCYDVPFVQQLGYFPGNTTNTKKLLAIFYRLTKYGHYNFNYKNYPVADARGVTTVTNLVIDLASKESITDNFTKSFSQSLHNASGNGLSYITATPGEAIEMYRDLYGKSIRNISATDYQKLAQLTATLTPGEKCFARKIINRNGDTLSIVLLLKDEKRLYNIINATNDEGRKTEANYFLYAQAFYEFAGKGLLFDFEGSELPGIKSFYKKMGAKEQPYYRMHINNLPFPLNLLKR